MPVEREIHRRNGVGLGKISAVAVPRHGRPFQQFPEFCFWTYILYFKTRFVALSYGINDALTGLFGRSSTQ